MRSRYSAYALRDQDYLRRTWHPSTRPKVVEFGAEEWTRLDIVSRSGSFFEDAATVEFRAQFRLEGKRRTLHEHSRFVRELGRWRYVGPV
jgi:SEC-C motif domain protein